METEISNEISSIIKKRNKDSYNAVRVEKVSEHDEKYKINLGGKNYFIYLYKDEFDQKQELEIFLKLERLSIIAPMIISIGKILDGKYYYNLVSEIKMKTLKQQEIRDYGKLAEKTFQAIKELHSIKKDYKCLIHANLQPGNICYDEKNVAFLDFSDHKFDDELLEFTWIFLANKVYARKNKSIAILYEKLWDMFINNNPIDKKKMLEYTYLFAKEKRFNGKLNDSKFMNICIDTILKLKLPYHKDCLETLHIPIGYSCNNNCVFCMESDRDARYKKLKDISEDKICRILDEKINLNKVIFTSGEPTLNPNLINYIKLAKVKGYQTIGLVTNGRRLSYKKYAASLLVNGMNEVIISIHSTQESIHEALTRTKGSFKESWQGLLNMDSLKKIYDFKLYVSLVLNKLNLDHIDEDIKTFSKFDIDFLILNTMQPCGRGNNKSLIPQYIEIVNKIKIIQKNNIPQLNYSVIDMPLCVGALIKDNLGNVELCHIKESGKYLYSPLKHKMKRKECRLCRYDYVCEGVWKNYIKHYGWEEFHPPTNSIF